MKILIIAPTQQEFEYFLQSCTKRGFRAESSAIGRIPVVRFPELGMTLARGGNGKAQFAIHTQHLLDACTDWDLVICAGAAGSLVDDLAVGDVVVATTTVEHDYNNRFNERPVPRFQGAQATTAELQRVSLPASSFKVQFGTIASGDEDVVDVERRNSLHQSTGALVVAWEGAGGARACDFSQVPFVEIRSVSDGADHNASSDFDVNLKLVMDNVVTLIIAWIESKGRKKESPSTNPTAQSRAASDA